MVTLWAKEIETVEKDGVQETSIFAKTQVDIEGVADTQREKIKDFIKNNPDVCIREISESLEIQKSTVSPRVNELRKTKEVVYSHDKTYKGKTVMGWRVE